MLELSTETKQLPFWRFWNCNYISYQPCIKLCMPQFLCKGNPILWLISAFRFSFKVPLSQTWYIFIQNWKKKCIHQLHPKKLQAFNLKKPQPRVRLVCNIVQIRRARNNKDYWLFYPSMSQTFSASRDFCAPRSIERFTPSLKFPICCGGLER